MADAKRKRGDSVESSPPPTKRVTGLGSTANQSTRSDERPETTSSRTFDAQSMETFSLGETNRQALPMAPGSSTTVVTGNQMHAGNDLNILTAGRDITVYKGSSTRKELNAILTPVDAAYDSYTSTANRRIGCFEGTRVDLLRNIQDWLEEQGSRAPIYFLDGVAGIGKSTVAQTIAETSAAGKILGASFFFSRNEEQRKIAKYFFLTIAFQLSCFNEEFGQEIAEVLNQHPDVTQKNLLSQFKLLILQPLKHLLASAGPPVLLVIDALDECDEEEAEILLTLLADHICDLPRLRLFITSRPEQRIRDVLLLDKNHERFHLHEIEDSVVQSDIRLYLDFHLSICQVQKLFKGLQWEPDYDEMQLLYGICGTLFIIASTSIKFILDPKRSKPARQLARLLDGVSGPTFSGSKHTDVMDKVYINILCCAIPDDLEDDDDWFYYYQAVLGAILVLQNPLPCQVLSVLLDIKPQDIESALSQLHSLVAPSEQELIFRVHHKSFPDFIINEDRIKRSLNDSSRDAVEIVPKFLINPQRHHLGIAKACFRAMHRGLVRNMGGLTANEWYKDKTVLPHLIIPSALEYACRHWATHLDGAGSFDEEIRKHLEDWTLNDILAWLETMCILDRIQESYWILEKGLKTVGREPRATWGPQKDIQDILKEACKFIQRNGEVINLSPMHIYWSGLPFLPLESVISTTFKARYDSELKVIAGNPRKWDPTIATLVGHTGWIHSVVFSGDGVRLASAAFDRTIRVWDGKTGAHLATLTGHSGPVSSVAFSRNGSRLASGSRDHTVRLWDGKIGAEIATLHGHSNQVTAVIFSSSGLRLASSSEDGMIMLWDGRTGARVTALMGHSGKVNGIAFSRDDSLLASASDDGTIRLWEGKSGPITASLEGHTGPVQSVAFSGDGLRLSSGSEDNTVRLWDGKTGAHLITLNGHSSSVTSVAFSADGSKLASASEDKTLRLWDGRTGNHITTLEGHSDSVTSVIFSQDTKASRFASGSDDNTIRIWDGQTGSHVATLTGHSDVINTIAFSNDSDGLRIASSSDDRTVKLWDAESNVVSHAASSNRHTDWVAAIAFSGDGSIFASGSHDKTVRLWNSETGEEAAMLSGHSFWVASVAFSNDGSTLASGSHDGTVRLWNWKTRNHLATLHAHPDLRGVSVRSVALSNDGSRAAAGFSDNAIWVWEGKTYEHMFTLVGHSRPVDTLTFSSNGSRLASGSMDHTVRLWNGETGAHLKTLDIHLDQVNTVVFSRDGSKLASASRDNRIHLWDGQTGNHLTSFHIPLYEVTHLTFYTGPQSMTSSSQPDTGSPTQNCLFTLVKRKHPRLTGLVVIKLQDHDKWDVFPICWFPPHLAATSCGLHPEGTSVAVGCQGGQVLLLDISAVMIP